MLYLLCGLAKVCLIFRPSEAGGFRVADGKVHLPPESLEAYEAVMLEPQSEPKILSIKFFQLKMTMQCIER
jgi:hypothetical protein